MKSYTEFRFVYRGRKMPVVRSGLMVVRVYSLLTLWYFRVTKVRVFSERDCLLDQVGTAQGRLLWDLFVPTSQRVAPSRLEVRYEGVGIEVSKEVGVIKPVVASWTLCVSH